MTYRRFLSSNFPCWPFHPDVVAEFSRGPRFEELVLAAENDLDAEAAVEAALRYVR